MSKASQIITLSADLAVLTIKEGVSNVTKIATDGISNVTKIAADGVSKVTSHLLPHQYDDLDNRSQFTKWASFASFLVATLGSELMILAKLKKNTLEKGFDGFVRGHVVPAVGSLAPALSTIGMLFSIGNPDTLEVDKTLLAGTSLLLVNLIVIDVSILKRAISNIRNPKDNELSLDLNNNDTDMELLSESKADTRREKIASVLIPLGWALAIGAGIAANYVEGDEARTVDIVLATTSVTAFKDVLVFPIAGRKLKGTDGVSLGGGYQSLEETSPTPA